MGVRWRSPLHDRRFGVQALDLEARDALVVGGDVFQLLPSQHVGDIFESVGRALPDQLHHLLGAVAAVEQDKLRRGRTTLGPAALTYVNCSRGRPARCFGQ